MELIEVRTRLAAAGVEVSQIREPVAGVRVFDARDPDGNRFSLESRAPRAESPGSPAVESVRTDR